MSRYRLLALLGMAFVVVVAACQGTAVEPTPPPATTASIPVETGEDAVRVGVLAIRSAVAASAQYQATITYLAETLNRPFELVPVTQESQFSEVEEGNLDFTLNNPLAAVQLRRLYNIEFLVTISLANTGTEFGGLIVVRKDSGIETVEDLRGKRGTCVAFQTAAAGCNFQVFYLQQAGFDPYADFSSFTETPSQDNIVLGVLNNTFDAGFIRTGQLEKMLKEGTLLNLDEIHVLDEANDSFFYPHTGPLYPEWPLAALSDTDPALAEAVREALLAIPAGHPALVDAGAASFVPAVDYQLVDDLIVTLKLRSWDAP